MAKWLTLLVLATGCSGGLVSPDAGADECPWPHYAHPTQGDIPVCSALVEYYGACTFEDYDGSGADTVEDFHAFCHYERDGDTPTSDVEPDTQQPCWVCD